MELHKTGNFPIDRLCKIYNVKDFHQALEDIEQGKVSTLPNPADASEGRDLRSNLLRRWSSQ